MSFAGVLPRTILTGRHSVSGNVTICVLRVFFSMTCFTVSTVGRDLDFDETFAAYPSGAIRSSVMIAPRTTLAQMPLRIAPPDRHR